MSSEAQPSIWDAPTSSRSEAYAKLSDADKERVEQAASAIADALTAKAGLPAGYDDLDTAIYSMSVDCRNQGIIVAKYGGPEGIDMPWQELIDNTVLLYRIRIGQIYEAIKPQGASFLRLTDKLPKNQFYKRRAEQWKLLRRWVRCKPRDSKDSVEDLTAYLRECIRVSEALRRTLSQQFIDFLHVELGRAAILGSSAAAATHGDIFKMAAELGAQMVKERVLAPTAEA